MKISIAIALGFAACALIANWLPIIVGITLGIVLIAIGGWLFIEIVAAGTQRRN